MWKLLQLGEPPVAVLHRDKTNALTLTYNTTINFGNEMAALIRERNLVMTTCIDVPAGLMPFLLV